MAGNLPLCLLVLVTFGSGFHTHFILMKQTLTKPLWKRSSLVTVSCITAYIDTNYDRDRTCFCN